MTRGSGEKDSTDNRSGTEVVIAGAVAGVVSRFCIAPLDVVKIRLQLQPTFRDVAAEVSATATAAAAGGEGGSVAAEKGRTVYKGIYGTMKTIVKEEGFTALWKGNIPAELLYLTYGATQFYTYRQCHLLLSSISSSLPQSYTIPPPLESTIAGGLAGGIATSLTYPLDLLRTRFAASKTGGVYDGLRHSVRHIYEYEGWRGFYRGGAAAVVQIVPYMGLFFGSYESVRVVVGRASESLRRRNLGDDGDGVLGMGMRKASSTGWEDAVSGVAGGVIAKTGVFPLDTIRKRLQVQGPTREMYVHGDIPVYQGVIKCGRDVVRREGWRGLYRGLTVSLLKAAPTSAITMWTFERAMAAVKWYEGEEEVGRL